MNKRKEAKLEKLIVNGIVITLSVILAFCLFTWIYDIVTNHNGIYWFWWSKWYNFTYCLDNWNSRMC